MTEDYAQIKIPNKTMIVGGNTVWRNLRRLSLLVIGVLTILLLVKALRAATVGKSGDPTAKSSESEPLLANGQQTTPNDQADTVFSSGFVVPQRMASVSSKATGRIKAIHFTEGVEVKAGQLLAELENDDLQAKVAEQNAVSELTATKLMAARSEEVIAERDFTRAQSLSRNTFLSKQEFDATDLRYHNAKFMVLQMLAEEKVNEARLRQAQTELAYSIIRAPFDGIVLTKNAEVGEVVAPFGSSADARAAVAVIADMGSLMVEADVAESYLARVSPGQKCIITLDSLPDIEFTGNVSQIVPTVDRAKATVQVKIRFETLSPQILPEMSARVKLLPHERR